MLGIAAFPGTRIPRLVAAPKLAEPTANEVLCRTIELGVCGTDREILLSEKPWLPANETHLILGHECLARIEFVGSDVRDFAVGELVVPAVRRPFAGQTRRLDLLPFGTFTERGIVQEHGFSVPQFLDRPEHLYRVDPAIASFAVLTEPLAVAEKGANEAHVLQQARLGTNVWNGQPPRVLVTGQGPIAFAAVLACVARGWRCVLAGRDEPETFRSQLVRELESEYWSLGECDLAAIDDVEQNGFDLVLECTGSDELTLAAAAAMRSCGIMVWLGSSRVPEARQHNVERLMRDGLLRNNLFIGSVNCAPRDFHDALAHLAWWKNHNAAALGKLITARVKQADALWHYEHRQPQGIKTIVQFAEN
ncbi:alcohol dehydrogenase catalytic domain-containing protein [Anatilimnocola floriformis]|uniref:alcohol dehydrogenase catalytic domain-containing protein n=1 Tax=Anatilimnocola floriformis TaxID=2948575 RepID=UPI0020C3DD30|nr:alcohol dehydrogenase catalytic domain-containing protein [Anatilimnocola floriformis]